MASCSGCTQTWTAETLAHCAGCHLTFHSPASFDQHRVRYQCVNPLRAGLRWRQRYGITAWGLPSEGKIVRVSAGKLDPESTETVGVG